MEWARVTPVTDARWLKQAKTYFTTRDFVTFARAALEVHFHPLVAPTAPS
jgi:hypothetical protein